MPPLWITLPVHMDTQVSLLDRARGGDRDTWDRLIGLYQPLVRGWLVAQGVVPQDADDLTQDVLLVLVRKLPEFEHSGRPGAFRAWLRTVTVNQAKKFWRAGRCRPAQGAAPLTEELLDQLADSDSALARAWDAEYDRQLYRRLLAVVEAEFKPSTVTAFRRLVLERAEVGVVSAETGLTPAALYSARYRVLRRLREEAARLTD